MWLHHTITYDCIRLHTITYDYIRLHTITTCDYNMRLHTITTYAYIYTILWFVWHQLCFRFNGYLQICILNIKMHFLWGINKNITEPNLLLLYCVYISSYLYNKIFSSNLRKIRNMPSKCIKNILLCWTCDATWHVYVCICACVPCEHLPLAGPIPDVAMKCKWKIPRWCYLQDSLKIGKIYCLIDKQSFIVCTFRFNRWSRISKHLARKGGSKGRLWVWMRACMYIRVSKDYEVCNWISPLNDYEWKEKLTI